MPPYDTEELVIDRLSSFPTLSRFDSRIIFSPDPSLLPFASNGDPPSLLRINCCWICCRGELLFDIRKDWAGLGIKALLFLSLLATSSCLGTISTADADRPTELALLSSTARPPCTYSTVGSKNYKFINLPKLAPTSPSNYDRYIALALYTSFSLSSLLTLRWKSRLHGNTSSSTSFAVYKNLEEFRSFEYMSRLLTSFRIRLLSVSSR